MLTSALNVALNQLVPVFLVLALGVLLDRLFGTDPRPLSQAGVYLFAPCLILDSIVGTDLQVGELGQIALMAVLTTVLMAAVGWGLARLMGADRAVQSALMLSLCLVNAGALGMPISEFAFGPAGLQRAVIWSVMELALGSTLGVFLASSGKASMGGALKSVVTTPMVYSTAVGFALNLLHWEMPLPIGRAVSLLGQACVPVMATVLGLQLSRAVVRGRITLIALGTVARLALAPVIAVGVAALLGMAGTTRQVSILEASMPAGIMSVVFANEFGGDSGFVTSFVLVTTVASLLSLSVLLLWLM